MNAMTQVIKEALNGSFVLPFPLAIKKLKFLKGNEASPPSACSVRGATIIDPMAEDIVEAANPSGITMGPHSAILLMTS